MINDRITDMSIPASTCARGMILAAGLAIAFAAVGCGKAPAGAAPEGEHAHAPHSGQAADAAHAPDAGDADEVTLTADAVARYGIKLGRAVRSELRDSIPAPARVSFNTEAMAHIGSPLRGRVVEARARMGDAVKEGQELLAIESPELGEAQADLLQRRTTAQTAGPAAELARSSWERAKGVYERSQGIALAEVQRREAEYRSALAVQHAAESAATAAENRLHLLGMSQEQVDAFLKAGRISARFTIRAPIDATVVQREVTLGELVGPERESLLVLADTRSPWVLAEVTEADLRRVKVGAKAWVTVGTDRWEGTVTLVSPSVDTATRTDSVRIEIPDTGGALKPGMFAQAEIAVQVAAGAEVLAVPDEAIQTVEGGPAVFVPVEGEPNTFARRAVVIGKAVGGMVPVLEGLEPDEELVVAGSFILKAELGKAGAAHEH